MSDDAEAPATRLLVALEPLLDAEAQGLIDRSVVRAAMRALNLDQRLALRRALVTVLHAAIYGNHEVQPPDWARMREGGA